jgi:hypothetical protein
MSCSRRIDDTMVGLLQQQGGQQQLTKTRKEAPPQRTIFDYQETRYLYYETPNINTVASPFGYIAVLVTCECIATPCVETSPPNHGDHIAECRRVYFALPLGKIDSFPTMLM